MCQTIHSQQKEQTIQHQEQEQVLNQLDQLQNWDLEEKTLAQRREEQTQQVIRTQWAENEELTRLARVHLQPAQANQAAAGAPVQDMAPAQDSYKRRREIRNGNKQARKHTPAGDYVSYAVHQQLTARAKEIDAVGKGKWREEVRAQGVDPEAISGFLQGHQTGWLKNNTQRDEDDRIFIEDYVSKDLNRRLPYLQGITQLVLDMSITSGMFTDEYLERHAGELMEKYRQLHSFKKMMDDPVNRRYFTLDLSPNIQEMLGVRMEQYTALGNMLRNCLAAKGLNMDGSYNPSLAEAQTAQQNRRHYENELRQTFRYEKDLRDRQMEVIMEENRQQLRARGEENREMMERDPRFAGLGLTSYHWDYTQDLRLNTLAGIRDEIAAAPQQYAANKEKLDRLYQQLYRTLDAMGNVDLDSRALSSQHLGRDAMEIHQLLPSIHGRLAEIDDTRAMFQREVETLSQLIRHFLTGEALTDRVKARAIEEGLLERELDPAEAAAQEVDRVLRTTVFSEFTPAACGVPLDIFMTDQNVRKTMPRENEPEREGLPQQFTRIFSDVERYGRAYSGFITKPSGNAELFRMSMSRTAAALEGSLGHGYDTEGLVRLFEKLLCGGRYHFLKKMEPENMTKEEREELESYTPERLEEMDQRFEEGVLEFRELLRGQAERVMEKYGRFISQMHPEDFCARLGREFFEDTLFLQDLELMMRQTPQYFDFEHNAEDRKLRAIDDYLQNAILVLVAYFSNLKSARGTHGDGEKMHQEFAAVMNTNQMIIDMLLENEGQVEGAGFTQEEQAAYQKNLEQRFQGDEAYKLNWGRFAPARAN